MTSREVSLEWQTDQSGGVIRVADLGQLLPSSVGAWSFGVATAEWDPRLIGGKARGSNKN